MKSSYDKMLDLCVQYLETNGSSERTLQDLENMLPKCWAADLIFEALETYCQI